MKIDRLIAIVMMLLEHEVMSASELASKLEVSRRTIYRDIDALTMAGLPIYTVQGVAGGVGLMKSYKVDKRLFTSKDVRTLTASLESYGQLYDRKTVVPVLEKLRQMETDGPPGRESAFAVDLSLPQGNQMLRSKLSVFETAINGAYRMTFDYIDKNGNVSSRTIEPYRVVFKESSWYVQAYCMEKEQYRIFKLARMSKLQRLPETFVPRSFVPLPMDGGDWMNRGTVPVTIRIALSVMDKVIERFGEDHIVAVEEDSCIAVYPIADHEAGYDALLRFGAKCEVLAPPEIREAFAKYVKTIWLKYAGE